MSETENPILELISAIEDAYSHSYGEKAMEFVSEDNIEALVNESNVTKALNYAEISTTDEEGKALVDFVCNKTRKSSARCIFLILVMMSEHGRTLSLLKRLKEAGIDDSVLPIAFYSDGRYKYQGYRLENPDSDDPERNHLPVFAKFERNDRTIFGTHQWLFLAPVFGVGNFRFRFHKDRRLPFTEVSKKPVSSGFFGEVSRAEVLTSHVPNLQFPEGAKTTFVATKKAKDGDEIAKIFDDEAGNLEKVKHFKSPHLIKPIAAYDHGQDKCLLFPWAQGGNLRNYWIYHESEATEKDGLEWILRQFVGIFSALEELHEHNCRHGDLKPENILWFCNDFAPRTGSLEIADLGLTTFHEKEAHTKARRQNNDFTNTPSGTSRYEPPEMDKNRGNNEVRSREYDVWSMGCILLELLIWLVYGYTYLVRFQKETPFFWVKNSKDNEVWYSVAQKVQSEMTLLAQRLAEQPRQALLYQNLLDMIENKLLVVEISDDYKSCPGKREIAKKLHTRIREIYNEGAADPQYLTPVRLLYQGPGISARPAMTGQQLDVPEVFITPATGDRGFTESQKSGSHLAPQQISDHQQKSTAIDDTWVTSQDNEFASRLFTLMPWDDVKPRVKESSFDLCQNCSQATSARLFPTACDLASLQATAKGCSLCSLLLQSIGPSTLTDPNTGVIKLRQNSGVVGIQDGRDLLSVYADPDNFTLRDSTSAGLAQLGLPALPKLASPHHFTLLKEWARVCDANHDTCRRRRSDQAEEETNGMPTRLIEIGEALRLVESSMLADDSRYIALSHCWGELAPEQRLCTTSQNLKAHKSCIDLKNMDQLPPLFRDAVMVTRGIGIKYLWIDSLCIVQDDPQDWEYEAARMEQVFSNAYLTIGASSAHSSAEGFLLPRSTRACLKLRIPVPKMTSGKETQQIYVCPAINNFSRDVEDSHLSRRGWVLQERALSRRSVFYTSTQVYWECGAGVHCETLARLQNSKASFLGDANFPESAQKYYRDGRQTLVRELYERYTSLAFSHRSDRPVAILGLQVRLARVFNTFAAYGCFSAYFARGLLWRRNRNSSSRMTRLPALPGSHRLPSWSWFSKNGAIEYLQLKYAQIDWATDQDFENPFPESTSSSSLQYEEFYPKSSSHPRPINVLRGLARKLIMPRYDLLVYVTFDLGGDYDIEELLCVVVGRDKVGQNAGADSNGGNPKYHVIVIRSMGLSIGEEKNKGQQVYERVGVASLRPEHVADEGEWVDIW